MRPILKTLAERAIGCLVDFKFQDFVCDLMLAKHGSDSFKPIRQVHDRGCDGILEDRCIIACYGPKKYEKRAFTKKAQEDWDLYKTHWKKTHSDWRMVLNHHIAPDQEIFVRDLRKKNELWGLKHLVHELENSIPWGRRRKLLQSIEIPDEQIGFDTVHCLIEDLVEFDSSKYGDLKYVAPDLTAKIELNYSPGQVERATEDIQDSADTMGMIHATLNENPDWVVPFKRRLKRDFEALPGSFQQRMDLLFKLYKERFAPGGDDIIESHIRGLQHYVFEQCFIGKEPKKVA